MVDKTDYQLFCPTPLTKGRLEAYRLVIRLQIAFSCFSLLTICVILPILYNHVQNTINYVEKEMLFCENSNADVIIEMEFGQNYEFIGKNRTVRQSGNEPRRLPRNGQIVGRGGSRSNFVGPDLFRITGIPLQTQCPGCCISGPIGARGSSGIPGKPGNPGSAGPPGQPGFSPQQTCPKSRSRQPPPCRPCPKGRPGVKGWPGFPGDPGPIGEHGRKGRNGVDGLVGPPGPQGPPGYKGSPGTPGEKGPTPEAHVQEGPQGYSGSIGPVGSAGLPGLPGRNGLTGAPGDRGWPGLPGEAGENGYPGPEGPAGTFGPPGSPGTCVCQNVDSIIVVDSPVKMNPWKAGYGDK